MGSRSSCRRATPDIDRAADHRDERLPKVRGARRETNRPHPASVNHALSRSACSGQLVQQGRDFDDIDIGSDQLRPR